jgi:molecular chaperone GrpE
LEKYGTAGDEFDPQIHEALMHDTSADVSAPTATKILQPGYRYKERILRPARVAVTDPTEATAE